MIFKDHYIQYVIATFSGIFLLIVALISTDRANMLIPLACLWIILCAVGMFLRQTVRNKRFGALLDDCRAREYLEAYQKHPPLASSVVSQNYYYLNLAAGHLELGELAAAADCFARIHLRDSERLQHLLPRISYLLSYTVLQRELGKQTEAEATLAQLPALLQSSKLSQMHKTSFEKAYISHKLQLQAAQGNHTGVIPHFEAVLETAPNKRARAAFSCVLAEAYLCQGQAEKALPLCRFVLENGGDTKYTARAKAYLERIENTTNKSNKKI